MLVLGAGSGLELLLTGGSEELLEGSGSWELDGASEELVPLRTNGAAA